MDKKWIVRSGQPESNPSEKQGVMKPFSDESEAIKYYTQELDKGLPEDCNALDLSLETGNGEILKSHQIFRDENCKIHKNEIIKIVQV